MSPLAMSSLGNFLATSASKLAKRAYYSDDGDTVYVGWLYDAGTVAVVLFWVLIGLCGSIILGWLIALVVFYSRQQKRKKWYGPMAQYYRERGFGGTGLVGFNGAMYIPQTVYVPVGGQVNTTGIPQALPGSFAGGPVQYSQSRPVTQESQLRNQPVNTAGGYTQNYGNGFGAVYAPGYGPGGNTAAYGEKVGGTEKDITGPTYPAPTHPPRELSGATAHDPFASPRSHPYSHAPSRSQSESHSHSPELRGKSEVHSMHSAQNSGVNNTMSFYTSAIPTGSYPNVTGGAEKGSSRY